MLDTRMQCREPGRAAALPGFAVRVWRDCSSRYGFAYLLVNGVVGVCFNDATRIVAAADGSVARYWDGPAATGPETLTEAEWAQCALQKKIRLMMHFRRELRERAGADSECEAAEAEAEMEEGEQVRHVKHWARTEHGILFRMANRDVQANFRDHAKLVIDRAAQRIFYAHDEGVEVFRIKEIGGSGKEEEIRARLMTIKEMARHLS
jgi:polo-like kinase 1